MRRTGTVLVGLGAIVLLVSAIAIAARVAQRGGDDAPLSVAVNGGADPHAVTNEVIAFFQGRVERDPVDFISYTKLGQAYVRQARETGDIGAYERAEAALRTALQRQPDYPDAQASLATVLFAKHDFTGALALAEQVYAADPSATQALAIIGDAHVELGEYDSARTAYGRLANAANGPPVLSRQAHLYDLTGDPDKAIDLMKQAEREASQRADSAEGIAWYRLQLGALYFNTGDYDAAQRWYAAAVAVFPGYHPALAGLGAVEAARGDDAKAIDYYEQSVAVVPLPINLAALGDLYARAGDSKQAQQQYDTVEFIGRLAEINRVVYNRELALFYADHDMNSAQAVKQALAELEVRKDVYGYDAAAWALYKAGRAAEAASLTEQALRLGTKDARLLFHAGMISSELGDGEQAQRYLQQALELNPHFSLLQEPVAREMLAALKNGDALAEAEDEG